MSSPSLPAELRPETANERVRALYEEHAGTLLKYARRRNAGLAEDVVSETFAVAVRRADAIPDGRELAWLYVVADYTLRNMLRGQGRADRLTSALAPLTPRASEPAPTPVIGEALGDLPERQRLLLTKTAFEGYSAEEAAELLGIPYGSARNALVSGRRRLAIGLAALGTAVVLLLLLRPVLSGSGVNGHAPARLEASITSAGAIHDIATIRRAGDRDADGPRATRYERWSDPSGYRQRVVLPGGDELTTEPGESLQDAARRVSTTGGKGSRVRITRRTREDLVALDASAPPAIAGVLSDPDARRSSRPGPLVGGQETMVLSAHVTTPGGVEQAVETTITNNARRVLRVRAQRLEAGRLVGESSVVEFREWTPLPPGPETDAALDQDAGQPSAGVAPTTAGSDERAGSSAADAAGIAAAALSAAGRKWKRTPAASGLVPTTAPEPESRLASAPITHVRQSVLVCWPGNPCREDGVFDVWLERGGKGRTRALQRKTAAGPVHSEEWALGNTRSYYRTSPNTGRTGASIFDDPPSPGSGVISAWRGEWWRQLLPQIDRLRSDPSARASLPAGPDVGGRPTVLAKASAIPHSPMGGTLQAELHLDPSTGAPREILLSAQTQGPSGAMQETYTLRVDGFDDLPAGNRARLVVGRFPSGVKVHDRRNGTP